MGLMGRLFGVGEASEAVGNAVENVAEVFTVNKTKAELARRAQSMATLNQYATEFTNPSLSWFDSFINGLNRLPRPIMALGTVGLFVFAMADPDGFAGRMQGLAYIPDPLWWLLGAVVSFYFGARELHYSRGANPIVPLATPTQLPTAPTSVAIGEPMAFPENAALSEWAALTKQAA